MTQTVLLGDIKVKDMPFSIIDGDRGAGYPKSHEFSDSGFCLFLSAKNVTKDGFDFGQKQFVTSQKDAMLRKGKVQRNDVILTTRGTVGNVALYDSSVPYDNVRINSGMIIIRCDQEKVLPKYLYFVLKSDFFQSQIENFRSGSAQPQLPIRDMQNMKLPLPSLNAQEYIINQIGTLDEKIELNRRMNETLEQMGQALFRHYFIDNPETEKWEEVKLSDISSYISRGISPKYDEEGSTLVTNQRCIRDGRLTLANARKQSKSIPDEKLLRKGDVLINSTGVGTLGRVAQVDEIPEYVTFDSHVTLVRPSIDAYFFGQMMRDLEPLFESMGSGSTGQTELSRVAVGEVKVLLPPNNFTSEFGASIAPLRETMSKNEQQIQTLTTLRDALLPRLISGRLKA